MCGICGVVGADLPAGEVRQLVASMTADLRRRGPDDEGTWVDDRRPDTAFGFRRLAVIDPSPAGAQPMRSGRSGAVLVFNGEIYNHRELGKQLEDRGVGFRSSSDTEVLLEGLVEWGVDLLPRLRGMFAFALFRPEDRSVLLARDHAGIKPLFHAQEPGGGGFAFSSRYDSLFRTGWLRADEPEPAALAAYLERKATVAPGTLHPGAAQLPPGTHLRVTADGVDGPTAWWSMPATSAGDLKGEDAVEAVGEALERSVRRHLVSDVPVGVFFSGGVDSPLVAGTAARQVQEAVRAFSISFPDWDLDEGPEAERMAADLGVELDLQSIRRLPEGILEAVSEAQDEPINDWSIMPTLLVSEHARRRVTVALSGDGGDELFFGYERPRSLTGDAWLWAFPQPVRRVVHAVGRRVGRPVSGALLHADQGAYYRSVHASAFAPELAAVAPGLERDWLGGDDGPRTTDVDELAAFARKVEFDLQLQRVLRKVDMASMHHSLEVRVPLLDPDVIAASLRVSAPWSVDTAANKPVLRALLDRLGTCSGPRKLGFGAPIAAWMAGPLRDELEALLTDLPPPFDDAAVRARWRAQVDGREDHRRLLWGIAMWRLWSDRVGRMLR